MIPHRRALDSYAGQQKALVRLDQDFSSHLASHFFYSSTVRYSIISQTVGSMQDKPLSAPEAAAYINCSLSHLYKLTSSRQIAFFKPAGKKIYFRKEDLDAYMLQGRVRPMDEIDQEAIDYVTLKS